MNPKKDNNEIYPNAPLEETIFEIKFPGEPVVECHRDLFFNKIRDKYPNVFIPMVIAGKAMSLEPYRFTSIDKKSGFMLSLNSLAFFTKDYKGFSNFKETIVKYFNIFKTIYKINKLNRTGLRYINIIPFIRDENNIFPVKHFLNINIQLPDSIPPNFKDLRISFKSKTSGGCITTQILPASNDKNDEVIILDFDYVKTDDLHINHLKTYLEESHTYTKSIFRELITDDYLKVMRGDVI